MKRYLLATLLLFFSLSATAGPDKFTAAMKGTLAMMDTATTIQTLQNCANRFERIGNAEKKKWLPFYYAALCNVTMSYMVQEDGQKDAHLDKAEEFHAKANELKVKDDEKAELVLLKGMIYGSRIQIDPQTRSMKYGPLSGQQYSRAANMDPENPRALYMQGQSLMFTPEMWGGGRDKAIPVMEEALEKFKAWEKPSEIHPDWGEEDCAKMLEFAKSGEKAPWEQEEGVEGETEMEETVPEED